MRRRRFWRFAAAILILTAPALFPSWSGAGESYEYFARKISDPKGATDFTLQGPDAKPYSLKKLRGRFVLLAFGFTHCPNVCPTTLANLAAAYELLSPAQQARVQVLFVTIDPERDTPAVLKDYVPFFEKDFVGLTGTPEQIAAVASNYGIDYEKSLEWGGKTNYTMNHSAGALLLDPSGRLIGSYRDDQLIKSGRVAEDLRHFLAQSDFKNFHWTSEQHGVVKTPRLSGAQLYQQQCASCHGANGEGIKGKYSALAGSAWVTGAPNRLTALVLDGVRNESKVGQTQGGVMPAWWRVLTPTDLAAVLTYIRQAWGNDAPAISAPYVQKLGYRFALRPGFWSWKELETLPPDKASDAAD